MVTCCFSEWIVVDSAVRFTISSGRCLRFMHSAEPFWPLIASSSGVCLGGLQTIRIRGYLIGNHMNEV
jgi:hypothetical protein